MAVDYNNIAKTFSQSRKNMKWEEIEYFLEQLESKKNISILDVGCGNGRFYGALLSSQIIPNKYLGIDLSSGLLEEARDIYKGVDFEEKNMLNISELDIQPTHIFFIASFHHLEHLSDRISVLTQAYNILLPGGTIYMTNWSLSSDINAAKYGKDIIENSLNKYGSQDYSIKFGDYARYYHGFSIEELEYLFKETGFEIIENREFDTQKNIISIIKKPLN